MSARNIKATLILSLTLLGCAKLEPQFNTEIFCPASSYRILILQTTRTEVQDAIMKAVNDQGSSKGGRFTVLYFPNKKNTSIYGATAKELLYECQLTERSRKPDYSNPASL